ncbi:hypothetical protein [Sphingomonas sp. NBWT7]|uniref:hypothetical protein n=1 Tax=Sphingomonas sp. NBWT7 TaxID=2596913 RepID=UPI0016296B50|nr:hypothetical protein [Sphingomonas sp. NBWT7]
MEEIKQSLLSSVFFMGFGAVLLLFLVATEHPNWFHIKPMSTAASAMTYAADSSDQS